MIREISEPQSKPCDANDADLYFADGLLNPSRFGAEFRRYPWYPFEDLSLEVDEVYSFIKCLAEEGCPIFRQTMPGQGRPSRFYELSSPTKMDALRLKEWLWLDENIVWSASGALTINRFSDIVILSWPDYIYKSVFGQEGIDLFLESKSIFTQEGTPVVRSYMELIKLTWKHRNHN